MGRTRWIRRSTWSCDNVKRYGLQEKEYEWYIFNQPDTILKGARSADPLVDLGSG